MLKFQRLIAFAVALFGVLALLHCTREAPSPPPVKPAAREIVVLTYGGEFAKAQRVAYFDPFERATGIKVRDVSYNSEYGLIKSGVQSGHPAWDVIDIDSSTLVRGSRENLYDKIDYSKLPTTDLLEQGRDPYGIATDLYSVSLAWNTKRFSAKEPSSWKDMWDLKTFRGPRTLQNGPKFTLEAALLADGVTPQDLYKGGLDVDRAFRSLDRIKPQVRVWWTTGQQPIQLLSSDDVALGAAYAARVWNAQHKDHQSVATTWTCDIIDIEYWAIPRGAAHKDEAMQFIAFASGAKPQAEFVKQIPLGVVNKGAFQYIDPGIAHDLNTAPENLKNQVFFDAKWWADHEQSVTERFNAWLAH